MLDQQIEEYSHQPQLSALHGCLIYLFHFLVSFYLLIFYHLQHNALEQNNKNSYSQIYCFYVSEKTICEKKNLNWQCLNMVFCKLTVKNLFAIQETRDSILGSERSPRKGNGYCSSILAWRIPWTEKTGVLQSTGL